MRSGVLASVTAALAVVAAGGCGDTGASEQELHEAYARGADSGREEGEAHASADLHDEWEAGYDEGLSDGEEEARSAVSGLEDELEDEYIQQEEELGWLEAEEEELEDEYGYEPSYGYRGHPTTEDFGSGNGYIVECEDGTMSDSGGIQGACSHHGGVR